MNHITVFITLLVCLWYNEVNMLKLPAPRVYVVTPRTLQIDEGRSAPRPFYYHNWMRRMDSPQNTTTTTTTTVSPVKTPDLIFAEFESDSMKNIRKLLENERTQTQFKTTSSTTSKPIYVPDTEEPQSVNYGLPLQSEAKKEETSENGKDKTNFFELYNNLYNHDSAPPKPIYLPSTTTSTTTSTQILPTTTTTTTTEASIKNVEDIWHIIDSEKHDKYSIDWEEAPVNSESNKDTSYEIRAQDDQDKTVEDKPEDDGDGSKIDENFALPGFGTNPGKGAENESRAIRTEPNIRFPYVNLKPFQMKNLRKPLLNAMTNSKKGNNMYTSLDNFFDVKNPVRGEAQDVVQNVPIRQPIDRYNPAQPYLPPTEYGSKSKQPSTSSAPSKAVANLVPPPPPPAPQVTADDFPAPVSYESFPPYAQSAQDSGPPMRAPQRPSSLPQPPPMMNDDLDSENPGDDNDAGPPPDVGYRYKPPSSQKQFLPTLPPLSKPFGGYSYNKPSMSVSPMDMDDKPDFQGYNYDKPPAEIPDKPDNNNKYGYSRPEAPAPPSDHHGYHYSKPEPSPPMDHPPSYGHHGPLAYHPESNYPELIFDKPHGGMGDTKGGNDMKGNDMGMVPPPLDMKPNMEMDAPGPPIDDSGFPHDFPGDLKFYHDFDDHDFYHHHHHHTTTTTTTTTETPRVNRFSYYYLGKKLYYLPLYFSVYFIIYVGALIIKAVLRHKIVYPNSWRPNDVTASFFAKRSVDSWDLSNENLHEMTGKVTHAIATAAGKYMKNNDTKYE